MDAQEYFEKKKSFQHSIIEYIDDESKRVEDFKKFQDKFIDKDISYNQQ